LIPTRVMRRTEVRPYVTYGLILMNVLVFIWQLMQGSQMNQIFLDIAANACQVTTQWFHPRTWIDMLRTTFLHGSIAHIVGNMMFLALFGPAVEEYLGRLRFLSFYTLAGFAAAITHAFVRGAANPGMCSIGIGMPGSGFVPLIGASGAIAGMMGAFLLLHPGVKIKAIIPIIGPIGPVVTLPAFFFLGYFFLMDLINGIGAITNVRGVTSQVAFWAHIGGFVFGAAGIFIATMWKPAPPQNIVED
jgi:membrane associated rhomboid family serine protease